MPLLVTKEKFITPSALWTFANSWFAAGTDQVHRLRTKNVLTLYTISKYTLKAARFIHACCVSSTNLFHQQNLQLQTDRPKTDLSPLEED